MSPKSPAYVVEGELLEGLLVGLSAKGLLIASARRGAGQTFSFEGHHIHNVRHRGTVSARSMYVVSPPIRWMGDYERRTDGALTRGVVDHAADE